MAWEWSHTVEAYADARAQVGRLPRYQLLEVLREWTYYDRERAGTIRQRPRRVRPDGSTAPWRGNVREYSK